MSAPTNPTKYRSTLRLSAGDLVEVRSRDEILATLDERGHLDALPFMPEMLRFCGQRFHVFKSAHKTCDTIQKTGGRRMDNAVHLEALRCDGEAHGGCQAGCLLFWNEAWLKPVDDARPAKSQPAGRARQGVCSADALRKAATRGERNASSPPAGEDPTYQCQATELLRFTHPLKWWDLRQYVRDVRTRNVTVLQLLRAFAFRCFLRVVKIGGYRLLTSAFDCIQKRRGGTPFPFREGRIRAATPSMLLGLQAGDMVRVKSQQEILDTVNKRNHNRGLSFDAEMVKYCGGTYRVLRRVDHIINEQTGRMMDLANDCIILDGVNCGAHYSSMRLFCPRAIYSYWRETWLTRV